MFTVTWVGVQLKKYTRFSIKRQLHNLSPGLVTKVNFFFLFSMEICLFPDTNILMSLSRSSYVWSPVNRTLTLTSSHLPGPFNTEIYKNVTEGTPLFVHICTKSLHPSGIWCVLSGEGLGTSRRRPTSRSVVSQRNSCDWCTPKENRRDSIYVKKPDPHHE